MTLTFNTHIPTLTQIVVCINQLSGHRLRNPRFSRFTIEKPKLPNLTLPLNRSRSTQCHHLHKLVELESPMQHAKFQDYRTSGSEEEDF